VVGLVARWLGGWAVLFAVKCVEMAAAVWLASWQLVSGLVGLWVVGY